MVVPVRRAGIALLFVLLLGTWPGAGPAEEVRAQDGARSAFVRYGFDRLHYTWDFEAIAPNRCLARAEGGQGLFCDGTQLTIAAVKLMGAYLRYVGRLLAAPPAALVPLVPEVFAGDEPVALEALVRLSKEQVRLREFKALKGAQNYFLNRAAAVPHVLEAPRRSPDCQMDKSAIVREFQRQWDRGRNADARTRNLQRFVPQTVKVEVLRCYDFLEYPYTSSPGPAVFDATRETLLVLRAPLFDALPSALTRSEAFLDLQAAGLAPVEDPARYLVTLSSFLDAIEPLSELFAARLGRNWTFAQVFEAITPLVAVRNHAQLLQPKFQAQFEAARRGASLWPQALAALNEPTPDPMRAFPVVEDDTVTLYVIYDTYADNFFADFAAAYAEELAAYPELDVARWRKRLRSPALVVSGTAQARFFGQVTRTPQGLFFGPESRLGLVQQETLIGLDASRGTAYQSNPLLALPFDGPVGLRAGALHRELYGLDLRAEAASLARCPLLEDGWAPATADSQGAVRLEVAVEEGPAAALTGPALEVAFLQGDPRHVRLRCVPSTRVELELSAEAPLTLFYGLLDAEGNFLPLPAYGPRASLLTWRTAGGGTVPDRLDTFEPPAFCRGWSGPQPLARLQSEAVPLRATLVAPPGARLGLACAAPPVTLEARFPEGERAQAGVGSGFREPAAGRSAELSLEAPRFSLPWLLARLQEGALSWQAQGFSGALRWEVEP